jgi:C-terminal processing protease CtpA/Prc
MIRVLMMFVSSLAAIAAQQGLADGPAISPFLGMRAAADGIEVQVHDATWYALDSVAGVDSETLLRESKRICGEQWWKRITEDLPALLGAMGTVVGDDIDLVLRDLATGERCELAGVKMTHEKRQGLREAHRGRPPSGLELPAERPRSIAADDALRDLEQFEQLLDERFAYRELRPVDLDAMLHTARAALGDGEVAVPELALWLDRILRGFGDGHSRIESDLPRNEAGFLPFLVHQVAGGAVAFRPDRSGLVDRDHPFVAAIDGVPIERWLEAAQRRGTQGSPMMQRREAERGLRDLPELRADLGLPPGADVVVDLSGDSGRRQSTLPLERRKPIYGSWPSTHTRRIEHDGKAVGYLRIAEMTSDPAVLDSLERAMVSFRDTDGLVIDVRGNGGGSRDALRRLLPYFIAPDAAPIVTNVAAARVPPEATATDDLLADRGLYPAHWHGFDAEQRAAISSFLRSFRPSWRLPQRKFSPYHFLVQRHTDNSRAFHYDEPVVVLIDRGCFSATDVFAAAFAALPRVTLVGEPTSGGSGRARGYRLRHSGIRLRLSSMASFRPDGVLFEGNGVEPDVAVQTAPTDLIGASDTVLARALALLRY